MTQSFWESEVVEEHPQQSQNESQTEPVKLALSVDEFSALEERVLRAVDLLRKERATRIQAEERMAQMETQLRDQSPVVERLEKELSALRSERDQVKLRVERLLAQLDSLEL